MIRLMLVGRAALDLGVRVGPEHRSIECDARVQQHDERVEDDPEEPQRPRDPPRQPLGVLDRVQLRDDLADRRSARS